MPCSLTMNCKVLCSSTKYGVAILLFSHIVIIIKLRNSYDYIH